MEFKEWLTEFKKHWKRSIKLIGRNMLEDDFRNGLSPIESSNAWNTGKGPNFKNGSWILHTTNTIGGAVPTRITSFGIQAGL